MEETLSTSQIEALVSLITDENPQVRQTCLRQVRRLAERALEPLRRQTRATPDPDLRSASLQVLRQLQLDVALRHMLRRLAQRRPILGDGAEALARIQDPLLGNGELLAGLKVAARDLESRLPPGASIRSAVEILAGYVRDDLGLRGNPEDYYDPLNSFLNKVLDRGIGIPISLGAVSLLLGRLVNIPLLGFNIPGHFLVGYRHGGEFEFVDIFAGGRRLGLDEALGIARSHGFLLEPEDVRPAADRDILVRMTNNLVIILKRHDPAAWLPAIRRVRQVLLSAGADRS